MRSLDVGILPICNNEKLLGTVTDRDLAVRAIAEGGDPNKVKVKTCAALFRSPEKRPRLRDGRAAPIEGEPSMRVRQSQTSSMVAAWPEEIAKRPSRVSSGAANASASAT